MYHQGTNCFVIGKLGSEIEVIFPYESKSEWKETDSNIQQCSRGGLLRFFIVSAYHENIVK